MGSTTALDTRPWSLSIDEQRFSALSMSKVCVLKGPSMRLHLPNVLEWMRVELYVPRCRDCNEPDPYPHERPQGASGTYQCTACALKEIIDDMLALSGQLIPVDFPGIGTFTTLRGDAAGPAPALTARSAPLVLVDCPGLGTDARGQAALTAHALAAWEDAAAAGWLDWNGQHQHFRPPVRHTAARQLRATKWLAGSMPCGCGAGQPLTAPRVTWVLSASAAAASCGWARRAATLTARVQPPGTGWIAEPSSLVTPSTTRAVDCIPRYARTLLTGLPGLHGDAVQGTAGYPVGSGAVSRRPAHAEAARPGARTLTGATAAARALLPPHAGTCHHSSTHRHATGRQPALERLPVMCTTNHAVPPHRPRPPAALTPRPGGQENTRSAQTTASPAVTTRENRGSRSVLVAARQALGRGRPQPTAPQACIPGPHPTAAASRLRGTMPASKMHTPVLRAQRQGLAGR